MAPDACVACLRSLLVAHVLDDDGPTRPNRKAGARARGDCAPSLPQTKRGHVASCCLRGGSPAAGGHAGTRACGRVLQCSVPVVICSISLVCSACVRVLLGRHRRRRPTRGPERPGGCCVRGRRTTRLGGGPRVLQKSKLTEPASCACGQVCVELHIKNKIDVDVDVDVDARSRSGSASASPGSFALERVIHTRLVSRPNRCSPRHVCVNAGVRRLVGVPAAVVARHGVRHPRMATCKATI